MQFTREQRLRAAAERQNEGRLAEAETIYRELLAETPDDAVALRHFGGLAGQAGKPETAARIFKRLAALRPGDRESHLCLGSALLESGWTEEAISAFRAAVQLCPNSAEANCRLADACQRGRRFEEAIAAHRRVVELQPHSGGALYNLGNGYDAAGRFDEAIDAYQRALKLAPDFAEAYNNLSRTLKPAPIQVTYLGYCGTSGLEAIDYRLSDPHFDPPGMDESCYREKTIRIPSYWCYEPHERTPQESAAPPNALLTFGCLNHPGKVTSGTLKLWLEILRSRPEAQLVLHAPEGACREELRRQFSEGAIAPDRLEFLGVQPLNQYLESWRRIDIALDPFPYAGGVTTCDALWMGTPVVSLRGETAVGRGGCSILANLGLEEWIAESPEDYVRIALTLARDLPQLHELRGSLRERMKRSILCDAVAFARSVESAYRQMWRQWCASRCRQDQGDQTFLK